MGRTADDVNRLIGEFTDLQETWETASETFDWSRLETLAQDGARAYNEGAGPSFHALALDGVEHTVFHERFLGFLLKAGFDPFQLSAAGTGVAPIPVIDHASLAEAAQSNPSSARMHAALMEAARERFAPVVEEVRNNGQMSPETAMVVTACAESIPSDLLASIAPELAGSPGSKIRQSAINPVEGYLSQAESIVESRHLPYG